jgi:transcriptional regulator with XRE-family HTH domain
MSKDEDRAALAARLKAAREYRGFSQEDVASHLGIPRSAISLMESGERRVEAIELGRLARLYQTTLQDLTNDVALPDDESVRMVARLAAELTEDDRREVMRFAQFLSARKERPE